MEDIYRFIGAIIAQGGGGALLAFVMLRTFGKSWLENKFDRDLENFKGSQARELEKVKSDISFLLTKSVMFHNKEYEVFPEVWAKLVDAKVALERSIRALREIPDFDSMEENQFIKILDEFKLSTNEKRNMTEAAPKKRNKEYIRILEWRDIIEANQKFHVFHEYLQKHRIFLAPDIKEKFDKLDDALWSTWVSKQLSHEDEKNFKRSEANNFYRDSVKPLTDEIENLVQQKLFSKI